VEISRNINAIRRDVGDVVNPSLDHFPSFRDVLAAWEDARVPNNCYAVLLRVVGFTKKERSATDCIWICLKLAGCAHRARVS